MTSNDKLRDLRAWPVSDDHLAGLHARLTQRADASGFLDVAYRTLDTPVGPLLLAATDAGSGAGGLRARGLRQRARRPREPAQPAHPARAEAPRRRG